MQCEHEWVMVITSRCFQRRHPGDTTEPITQCRKCNEHGYMADGEHYNGHPIQTWDKEIEYIKNHREDHDA